MPDIPYTCTYEGTHFLSDVCEAAVAHKTNAATAGEDAGATAKDGLNGAPAGLGIAEPWAIRANSRIRASK